MNTRFSIKSKINTLKFGINEQLHYMEQIKSLNETIPPFLYSETHDSIVELQGILMSLKYAVLLRSELVDTPEEGDFSEFMNEFKGMSAGGIHGEVNNHVSDMLDLKDRLVNLGFKTPTEIESVDDYIKRRNRYNENTGNQVYYFKDMSDPEVIEIIKRTKGDGRLSLRFKLPENEKPMTIKLDEVQLKDLAVFKSKANPEVFELRSRSERIGYNFNVSIKRHYHGSGEKIFRLCVKRCVWTDGVNVAGILRKFDQYLTSGKPIPEQFTTKRAMTQLYHAIKVHGTNDVRIKLFEADKFFVRNKGFFDYETSHLDSLTVLAMDVKQYGKLSIDVEGLSNE